MNTNMKEEEIIRERCGKKNPFIVPEGYFDSFTSNLMNALPESKTVDTASKKRVVSIYRKHIAIFAIAASICGIVFMGILPYVSTHHTDISSTVATSPSAESYVIDDAYINDALDYAMVSNQEIVQYLSESY